LVRGAHSIRAAERLAPEETATVRELEEPVSRIRSLALGEGVGFDEDMAATCAEIATLGESITDEILERVRDVQVKHARAVPPEKAGRDARYLDSLAAGPVSLNLLLGTAGRTLVFLNNLFRSTEAKALATKRISTLRRELGKVMGGKASNALLINLLKRVGAHPTEALRKLYGKDADIMELAREMEEMNARTPQEMIADFLLGLPPADTSPELAADRALLTRCTELGQGSLAEVFQLDDPNKEHGLDAVVMDNILAVALETFLAEHARGETELLADLPPTDAVRRLLDLVERYRPVLKTWNRLVARRG
ncbi:MAG TPA: hypothetical protein PK625_11550, partial [Spirochaetales bacterium]|nr:hypothetical protein [Spirochaetales bacterium]